MNNDKNKYFSTLEKKVVDAYQGGRCHRTIISPRSDILCPAREWLTNTNHCKGEESKGVSHSSFIDNTVSLQFARDQKDRRGSCLNMFG